MDSSLQLQFQLCQSHLGHKFENNCFSFDTSRISLRASTVQEWEPSVDEKSSLAKDSWETMQGNGVDRALFWNKNATPRTLHSGDSCSNGKLKFVKYYT